MDIEAKDFTYDANWFLARGWRGAFAVISAAVIVFVLFNALSAFLGPGREFMLLGRSMAMPPLAARVVIAPHWLLPLSVFVVLTVANRGLAWYVLHRTEDLPRKKTLFEAFLYSGEFISMLALKFSGGVESPMCLYFIAHTVVLASVVPPRSLARHIVFTSALFCAVALSEFAGLIPHTDLTEPPMMMYKNPAFVYFITLSVCGFMVYIGVSSWNIFRKMEERRRALAAALRARKDAEFFQDLMQHDITNCNHTLLGILSLLEKTGLNDKQKRYVATCMDQAARSDRLISRAQAFAWVGELTVDTFHPVDLGALVQDAVNIVKAYYVGKKIEILVQAPATPCLAPITELLNAAVINILDNAVKHNLDETAKISISLGEAEPLPTRFWLLCVEDNGPGVFGDMKNRIFERYADAGADLHTGLGLSLARAIIEKHGGRVWVEDRVAGHPDRGSSFKFTIPRQ